MTTAANWFHAFDATPFAEPGKWSKPVIVLTNLGNVRTLMYCGGGGSTPGCWQRPHETLAGEVPVMWTPVPRVVRA